MGKIKSIFKGSLSSVMGFRKFSVMLLLILIGVVFLVIGLLSGDNFVDLLSSTAIAFFGANVAEHATNLGSNYVKSKTVNTEGFPDPNGEEDER